MYFFGANLCSEGSLRRWTTARHGDSSMRLALMQLFQNTTSSIPQTNDLRQKGEKKPCNNQIILFGVCVSLLVALTQIRDFSSRWAITELRTSQQPVSCSTFVRQLPRGCCGNPFELGQSILEQFSGKPWHENMACPIAWHWDIIEKVVTKCAIIM